MGWTKCANGHNYSTDENTQCPYCPIVGGEKTVIHEPSPPPPPVSGGNRGVTAPIAPPPAAAPAPAASAGNKTIALGFGTEAAIEPVVGWLVCVNGKDRGSDFRIIGGWNTIGRDASMNICIPSDETVSRTDHAKLLFEQKNRTFHLAPGGGRNPVYVNGAVVLQPLQLNANDIIEVGETQLRFIPLCGADFNWD